MTTYSDTNDILADSYSVRPAIDDIATRIYYMYQFLYISSLFLIEDLKTDSTQETNFGRTYPRYVEMLWVRDKTTADDIATRILARTKTLQLISEFQATIAILANDLLSEININYYAGPVLVTDTMTITKIEIDLDTLVVSIEATKIP